MAALGAAAAREIEDPGAYVRLETKKIEAVQGLEQLIGSNQIKRDRAEFVKQKFEVLRKALAQKLQNEKRLNGDVIELEEQLKKGKIDVAKLIKQSAEDAVTIALVREDAEQSESEAGLARERKQTLTLEGVELQRIQDDLKKKIEQIQTDFFDAMVPVLGRLQIETKNAEDQTKEDIVKQAEAKKQVHSFIRRRQKSGKWKLEKNSKVLWQTSLKYSTNSRVWQGCQRNTKSSVTFYSMRSYL